MQVFEKIEGDAEYERSERVYTPEKLSAVLLSGAFIRARRRVFRQLIQALIYERTLNVRILHGASNACFVITGRDDQDKVITYHCQGMRRASFGRVRLTEQPLMRRCRGVEYEAESVSVFLEEIRESFTIAPEHLERFAQELEQTVLKDAMALHHYRDHQSTTCLRDMGYDWIESNLYDGHPYHPSYKSRIGFDYNDNWLYGPEFSPDVKPVWLAARKIRCVSPISERMESDGSSAVDFLKGELGEACIAVFSHRLTTLGERIEDYHLIPVHPWQWRRVISTEYTWDLHHKNLIFLGRGKDIYQPQQSIRTLTNITHNAKCYVKLSLGILNTSTTRGLAEHTVANAPAISDWLKAIVAGDDYLRCQLRTVFLAEVLGVSYLSPVSKVSTDSLACIWRESLHIYLDAGESAVPFSALTSIDRDGRPFINHWIEQSGALPWLRQLLYVSVTPIIHMLYAHGMALESHAQNMMLLHREGKPTRVALKDFHDGVRFMPDQVTQSGKLATLQATPAGHLKVNCSSYIQAQNPDDVRDFIYSAFFSMNLSELALFMCEHYSIPERDFWVLVSNTIDSYQKTFPDLNKRFSLFDLFCKEVTVEAHTKRRLQSENTLRVNRVSNPLHLFARTERDQRYETK